MVLHLKDFRLEFVRQRLTYYERIDLGHSLSFCIFWVKIKNSLNV